MTYKYAISGIYKITNRINGKFYIGSSCNIRKRIIAHRSALRRKTTANIYFQAAWDKYREENFYVELLAVSPREYLILLEQWFLDNLKPQYNIKKKAEFISDEKREKLSISNRGRIHSEETRKKISEAQIGKKQSVESRIKAGLNCRKPINQFTKDMVFIREWSGAVEASKILKIHPCGIFNSLNLKKPSAGGYVWRYLEDVNSKGLESKEFKVKLESFKQLKGEIKIKSNLHKTKPVLQFSLDNIFIREWDSIKECSEQLNISKSMIFRLLNDIKTREEKYKFVYKSQQ